MRSFSSSFGGILAAQYWIDFYLWECVLNENPQLVRIIELGTWRGGFSWYLDAQARARQMYFCTYDSIEHWRENNFSGPPPNFIKEDIFANAESIGNFISTAPVALFCDNGNKPREIKTFSPYLTNDSIILVHDWLDEIFPEDIPDYLEELYGDFCNELGSKTRVFRKKV